MTTQGVPRGFTTRLAWALIVCLGLLLVAVPVGAQSTDAPDATPVPEESGGIVAPTVVPDPAEGEPAQGEGTPTGDNEGALAPGFVTVILWTSDGNTMPAETSICVGSDCRPVGGAPQGAKVEFDDVPAGWQSVNVYKAAPYHDFSSSVNVEEGKGSRIDANLVLATEQRPHEPLEEIPVSGGSGRDVVDPAQVPAQNASDRALENSVVRRLPATGAGDASPVSGWWAVPAAMALVAGGLGVHQRWRHSSSTAELGVAPIPRRGYHKRSTV